MQADEIEVWAACTEGNEPPSADLSDLSAEERSRAARFRFQRDRDCFVLGKRVTRSVLARRLGVAPLEVAFAAGPAGKPELAGGAAASGWQFNLAHAGSWVMVALARGRPVGVDVERVRDGLEVFDLARRCFCPREIAALEAAPAAAVRLFFDYWTLKEAYLKAEGSGLGVSLTAMDASGVPRGRPSPPVPPGEDVPRGILVQRLPAPEGYAAALAGVGPAWTLRLYAWRREEAA